MVFVICSVAQAQDEAMEMEMQVRRTGPQVKIVRPARRPDIVYLRGEEQMQRREAIARKKYGSDMALDQMQVVELQAATANTVYKPLKRAPTPKTQPTRMIASIGKPAAKPAIHKKAKIAGSTSSKAIAKRTVKKTPNTSRMPASVQPATPSTEQPVQKSIRAKTKIAASN